MKSRPSLQWLNRKSLRFRSGGFSLLEIIVAMSLGMVLLGAVWTMFNLLGRRQASEMRQADRNQLIRSLHQRLTRDLKNLVALDDSSDQPLPDHSADFALFRLGASGFQVPVQVHSRFSRTEPAVALSGNTTSLALEVFVEPLETIEPGSASDSGKTGKGGEIFEGPARKQVCYEMGLADEFPVDANLREKTSNLSRTGRPSVARDFRQGLVRCESVIDQHEPVTAGIAQGSKELLSDHFSSFVGQNSSQLVERISDESRSTLMRDHVPDIAAIRFAYFDGRSWLSHWNSRDQNRLPVAIRIQFRFLEKETNAQNELKGDAGRREQEATIPLEVDIADEEGDGELAYDAEFLMLVKLQPIDLGASLPLRTTGRTELLQERDQ